MASREFLIDEIAARTFLLALQQIFYQTITHHLTKPTSFTPATSPLPIRTTEQQTHEIIVVFLYPSSGGTHGPDK